MDHGQKVPMNLCVRCGHKLTGAAAADGTGDLPREGHVSICIECANVAIYTKELKLRAPSQQELNEILSDGEVLKAIWAVNSAQKRRQMGQDFAIPLGDAIHMWCIYDHPKDFPEYFVARLWVSARNTGFQSMPTNKVILSKDLSHLHKVLDDNGLVRLERNEIDDPKILETWT